MWSCWLKVKMTVLQSWVFAKSKKRYFDGMGIAVIPCFGNPA